MKDFTKIAQAMNIQDSPEMALLNRVASEWQQGKMLIEWEIIPPINAKSQENMAIIVKILILMSVFYTLFFMLPSLLPFIVPPLFSSAKWDNMAIMSVLAILLTVVLQLFVALPLALKYLRSNRWRATRVQIDRRAKIAVIRRSSINVQTAAFGTPNVVLPAFRLPENNAGQYAQLKDSLQSKITAETGLPFEKFEEITV